MPKRGRPPKPLPEKLRRAAKESGMTNFEIAQHVGVQPSSVGRFLRGESDIKLTTADKMMRLFGFRVVSPWDIEKGHVTKKELGE
jgi:DNA-binding XRE family transcriptional regulator